MVGSIKLAVLNWLRFQQDAVTDLCVLMDRKKNEKKRATALADYQCRI